MNTYFGPTRLFTFSLVLATLCYLAFTLITTRPTTPPGLDAPPLAHTLPYIRVIPTRPDAPGYQRTRFGDGWAPSGTCTTRTDVIRTQLTAAIIDDCKLTSGSRKDPYGPGTLSAATPIEIDHVIPLSAAWDLGAAKWTDTQRLHFANDPINLVATSRELNQDKSDQLPASWLPPDRSARCWYARKVALVAATYSLPLPAADIARMRQACLVSEFPHLQLG